MVFLEIVLYRTPLVSASGSSGLTTLNVRLANLASHIKNKVLSLDLISQISRKHC